MKHTPGPWTIGIDDYTFNTDPDGRKLEVCRIDGNGGTIALLNNPGMDDARLIAAAPDLYDAAHNLISVCLTYGVNPDHPSIVHAYNAIQKAEVK